MDDKRPGMRYWCISGQFSSKQRQDTPCFSAAKNYCMGILKGLHRFDKESTSQFKDWVEDAPDEFFERILNDWKKACKKPEHIQEMEDFIERGLGN